MSKKWIFRAIVAAPPCLALVLIESIGHGLVQAAAGIGERIGRWVDEANA